MINANYTTTGVPQLKISCHADLQISGTPDDNVVIDIDDDSPASHIERQGDVILITAVRDCDITCPINAALTIEHASGDLRVMQVKGALAINYRQRRRRVARRRSGRHQSRAGRSILARCQRRSADRDRARRRETEARRRQRNHQ
jgi:hypothetical protein